MTFPIPNDDENLVVFNKADPKKNYAFIGNFHKTLPHNEFGEVSADAYRKFKGLCLAIDAGAPLNFEDVPGGTHNGQTAAKLNNPMASASKEQHGIDPQAINMPPAPGILSASTAAEMTELYWMALLRDVPIAGFAADPHVAKAVTDIKKSFSTALQEDKTEGALTLGRDLPRATSGNLDISEQTLFRCGFKDEDRGPLISQFFLHDVPFGVQLIQLDEFPYAEGRNYLTSYEDWILAQNTGKDKYGKDYGQCNFYADDPSYYAANRRKISTIRDLARFVNRDALHQAYFNAALFLDAINAPVDAGNPYRGNLYSRETGFGTLGGPDLLTLVSEVASRALKIIWRQKWLVHRRCRPEVYGGLMQMQFLGLDPDGKGIQKHNYGLPAWVATTDAAKAIKKENGLVNQGNVETFFLPMAFSAGSPTHPSYGAGHATVAGACVTVLKAWYDEDEDFGELLKGAMNPKNQKDPAASPIAGLLQPGPKTDPDTYGPPMAYTGDKLTVGGELNKLASNVAMGRSMGGVHWRSDNTRSLRLGEQLAIEILRKRTMEYAERPVSFSFRSFDQKYTRISHGQVQVTTS